MHHSSISFVLSYENTLKLVITLAINITGYSSLYSFWQFLKKIFYSAQQHEIFRYMFKRKRMTFVATTIWVFLNLRYLNYILIYKHLLSCDDRYLAVVSRISLQNIYFTFWNKMKLLYIFNEKVKTARLQCFWIAESAKFHVFVNKNKLRNLS